LTDFLADTYGAFLGFGLAMAVVWLTTPVVGELARRMGILDEPAARKIHQVPIPRLGGIAIFFGVIVPGLLFSLRAAGPADAQQVRAILAGAALVTLLGVLDDVRDIPPLLKLLGQLAVAGLLVGYGVRIEFLTIPGVGIIPVGWLGLVFSILWIVAIMNIVNFIDGMDGLAAGVCAISSLTFAAIAISLGRFDMGILAAIVGGSTIGFLWHNFHPASIFMGDSGSLLLGFLLAAISLQGFLKFTATVALLIPLLVLGIPIFDTGFAIARRVKNRRPIYAADRGHLHHRLANLGFNQRQAVMILYSWSGLMSLLALTMHFAPLWASLVVAVLVAAASIYLAYMLEILRWRTVRRALGLEPPPAARVTTSKVTGGTARQSEARVEEAGVTGTTPPLSPDGHPPAASLGRSDNGFDRHHDDVERPGGTS
jgi:UDP-GlcNAc:undecaprenyl-phosphate GlcNAc-1-phosphate transferase